jgi:Ca2+-binding EF-hand superfamily protein
MFEKLDADDSDTISLAELENAMVLNNIPMKSNYRPERKDSINSEGHQHEGMSAQKRQFIELKIIHAFKRLSQKMHKNHVSLKQVFDAYDLNRDGDINIKEFRRIMLKLDESLTDEEIQIAFDIIDIDNSQTIIFEEFWKYFCKCTGEPIHDYMEMRDTGKNK